MAIKPLLAAALAALIIGSTAAHAQYVGTFQPYLGSIYGGRPQGYTFQMEPAPVYRPPMPPPVQPPPTTCYTSYALGVATTRCN